MQPGNILIVIKITKFIYEIFLFNFPLIFSIEESKDFLKIKLKLKLKTKTQYSSFLIKSARLCKTFKASPFS